MQQTTLETRQSLGFRLRPSALAEPGGATYAQSKRHQSAQAWGKVQGHFSFHHSGHLFPENGHPCARSGRNPRPNPVRATDLARCSQAQSHTGEPQALGQRCG